LPCLALPCLALPCLALLGVSTCPLGWGGRDGGPAGLGSFTAGTSPSAAGRRCPGSPAASPGSARHQLELPGADPSRSCCGTEGGCGPGRGPCSGGGCRGVPVRGRCSAASPAGKAGGAAGLSEHFAPWLGVRVNETAPSEPRGEG